jgi:serine/threonine protein kinase
MDRKERIKDLLDRAWGLGPDERAEFLRRECGGDESLKREVEGLLAAEDNSPHLADSSAFRFGAGDETLGKILGGRYRVIRPLGKGGMGQVYLAEDIEIPSLKFAVKIFEQGFAKEVEALARVRSDRVVKIITTGKTDDGRPYMVMEYLTGQTLANLLDGRGRLPNAEVAQLMRDVCEAVTELHETKTDLGGQGIVHRDLKPSNVMVERRKESWKIKLFDLGVARLENPLMGRATSTHVPMGTPLYMAPEQFHGQGMEGFGCRPRTQKEIITPATDVYSLGVIAYEMLVGLHPFRGATNLASISAMQREAVYAKALGQKTEIPQPARAAVLKAMAFCPEARYQRAEEFGEELSKALTTARLPDKRRGAWAALVLAALVVAGALAWYAGWLSPSGGGRANMNTVANVNANSNANSNGGPNSNHSDRSDSNNANADGVTQAPERIVRYWFVTQRKVKDRLTGEPRFFKADEKLNDGWSFKGYFIGNERGHLYIINDGPTPSGMTLQILFPIPNDPAREEQRNNGTSEVESGHLVQIFDGDVEPMEGTEHLWVVWSAERIPQLETLTRYAVAKYKGKVEDEADARATRAFLSGLKQAEMNYDALGRMTMRGRGDVLAQEILLTHS